MPTYEYRCEKCGHEFEKVQRITAKPIRTCPKCRGKVQRLLGASGFILKGGGWYKTDYASGSSESPGSSGKSKKAEPCPSDKSNPACASCPAKTK